MVIFHSYVSLPEGTLGALLVYGRFMTCPVLGADQVQNGASPDEVHGARVVFCGFRLFFPQRKETQS